MPRGARDFVGHHVGSRCRRAGAKLALLVVRLHPVCSRLQQVARRRAVQRQQHMATKQPPNCCSQCCTLVRRKDGLLKCSRVTSTICEVVLPALMCALLILGSKASETDTYPELLCELSA
eukprot:7382201-Prymnesium_polylepis.4